MTRIISRAGIALAAAIASAVILAERVPADVGERPAAIVVFPQIVVDGDADTEITLANTAAEPIDVRCIYTHDGGTCGVPPMTFCQHDADCPVPGDSCTTSMPEIEFLFRMTPEQVLGWSAASGLSSGSLVIPSAEVLGTPFRGVLRCVRVDADQAPVPRDDLIGAATVLDPSSRSAAAYAAIGMRSTGANDGDGVLCLGAGAGASCPAAEYVGCPGVLRANLFTDGAQVEGRVAHPRLIVLPCHYNVMTQTVGTALVTLTLTNEFEQATAVQTMVRGAMDLPLNTWPGFSVGAQGTLGAQLVVDTASDDAPGGRGVLGSVFDGFAAGGIVAIEVAASVHGMAAGGAGIGETIVLAPLP